MDNLDVSIIIITFNDVKNMGECLDSVLAQKYGHKSEIIVVDGKSTDGTTELVRKYAQKHKSIKLIVEKSSITQARNIGIKNARYGLVAFTDSDCKVPKDWLKTLVDNYVRIKRSHKNLAGVGGANIPPDNINRFTYAIGIAFDSIIGSLGSIQAKRFESDKEALSISCTNSLYDKSALEAVSSFSEDLGNQGEDWDMGFRLRKKGFIVYGLKDSYVIHKMRTTPKKFWKNMVFYGDGRMRLIKKHGISGGVKYLLPFGFVIAMLLPIIQSITPITKLFFLPLLYFPFIILYSTFLCARRKEMSYLGSVIAVFLILHFGYAIGELKGLRWILKRR